MNSTIRSTAPSAREFRLPRISRFFFSVLMGLVLMLAAEAKAFLIFSPIVTTTAKANFTSFVYVDKTSAPEWVLFSGDIDVIAQVIAPRGNGKATSPSKADAGILVYADCIKGVGVTSGKQYTMLGILPVVKSVSLPGSLVIEPQFAVLLPKGVKPAKTLLVTVPVKTVLTFAANGKIQQFAAPPTGLVSWWQAEGTGRDSIGSNHGFLSQNETVGFAPGVFGEAFSFADQGFVQVPASPKLAPSTLTVSAWVRSDVAPAPLSYVVSKGAADCDAASYALYTSETGGLRFYVYNGLDVALSPESSEIWDGDWHHVAGTFDGQTVRLYVDGLEVGSGTPAPLTINYALPTHNDLLIGAYQGTCGFRFNGDVDGVQIYNRPLTPIELEGIFESGY